MTDRQPLQGPYYISVLGTLISEGITGDNMKGQDLLLHGEEVAQSIYEENACGSQQSASRTWRRQKQSSCMMFQ